jgi:hypothetical protein
MSPSAFAGVCSDGTLQTYIAQGSCSFQDLTFSGWAFSSSASAGADFLVLKPSEVSVFPCPGVLSACVTFPSGEEGFVFIAPWGVSSSQSQDSLISYTVTSSIVGAFFQYSSTATGSGRASITQTLSNGNALLLSNPPGTPLSVTQTFAQVSGVAVANDVELVGGNGSANVSEFGNAWSHITPVPEPGTSSLVGAALLIGLVDLARRRLTMSLWPRCREGRSCARSPRPCFNQLN